MRIGAHVRIAKGLSAATQIAVEIGCEAIQVFAANPNAWRSASIRPEVADEFRHLTKAHDLHPVVVHTPYLLNLASSDTTIHAKSTSALVESMQRARLLGAEYVVTHIGSHKGMGLTRGLEQIKLGVYTALEQAAHVTLLLENSAGSGDSVGSTHDELHAILDMLADYEDRIGICLDTAHLWSAGYDISNAEGVARTLDQFDSAVGLSRLKLIHLNDTLVPLGARVDRHANIGKGNIGEDGFSALLHHPALSSLAGIIETPAKTAEEDMHDIDILKRLRGD